ncbi:AAA family ATPase [Roseospira visakhapatnamensis]|uniref:Putative ATPase n=1 Tax=Roseospira visakhapatnamensis TaxID=390880 RepID=A0A7W6R9X3_9PROT|nr:ATP-binding protein [Roseospira visakhapatnamensis]MBB4264641.1 putative ATPase [Roseospira visakhapatnamensis]
MVITHVKIKNWRNFREAAFDLTQPVTYLIGPNASGKSNLIDVFRFLRDISKPTGGGLQQAMAVRGGIKKVRCLHARRDSEVRIEIGLSETLEAPGPTWTYILGFQSEGTGAQRPVVTVEQVRKGRRAVLDRPDDDDAKDPLLLTETHLEQTRSNARFRVLADQFASVTYLHLVPQLLKYGDQIGGNRLDDDPFGQGFLERIADTPTKTRASRFRRIEKALRIAVPKFKALAFDRDDRGRPHIQARYEHHRPQGAWQREDQFSDGTLRLLGILWSLLDGKGPLLIEEPELSLHTAVVEQLPALIARAQREAKHKRQIIISTHSEAMLSNPGIDVGGVVRLASGKEGSEIEPPTDAELNALKAGFSIAEAVLPRTRPDDIERLSLDP